MCHELRSLLAKPFFDELKVFIERNEDSPCAAVADSYAAARSSLGDAEFNYHAGSMAWSLDLDEQALRYFQRGLEEGSTNAADALGIALQWIGRNDEALPLLRSSAERDDGELSDIAAGALAEIDSANLDGPEIIALLRRARDADPSFEVLLAVRLGETGELAEARDILETAVERGDASACIALGNLLWDVGDQVNAELAFARGAELGDGHCAYNLSLLLDDNGERARARAALKLAAQLGHEVARGALEAKPG